MVKTERVILDSNYRYSGTNNNPKFIIPNTGIRAEYVYINSISIPHTFYNINENNNTFVWGETAPNITSTIPVGDYTISELVSELQTQFTNDSPSSSVYSVTTDSKTKKITIDVTSGTADTFWMGGYQVIREILGLYTFGDNGGGSWMGYYGDKRRNTSTQFNFPFTGVDSYYIGVRTLYIGSNLLSNIRNYTSFSVANNQFNIPYQSGRKDIITFIPVTTTYGDLIKWDAGNSITRMNIANNITDLEFNLYDEAYNKIDLNGRSWTIELVFEADTQC